jgi:hypothetical protein
MAAPIIKTRNIGLKAPSQIVSLALVLLEPIYVEDILSPGIPVKKNKSVGA